MAGMLEYLMGPQENQLARIGGAMSSGFDAFQGEQDRQTAAAEKRRLLAKEEAAAKIAAEDRRIKTAESDYDRRQKAISSALAAGDRKLAKDIYNAGGDSAAALNLPHTPMVGGLRALTNQEAAAMPGKVEDLFSYDAQGNFRPAVQDENNNQSFARLQGYSNYRPEYKSYNSDDDIYDQRGELVRKGVPKPQFFANGAGVYNQQTGKVDSTGFTPPMTPDQLADNKRADDALAFRKQVQSEAAGLRAAAAKVRDERGMAALRLRAKAWARKTATNELTGLVDQEQAALNEEQLMQELGLIAETAKGKQTVASPAVSANAQQASQRARTALTSVLGGGPGYLAFSQAYPEAHAAMLEFYRQRGMGNKSAVMPYTGEEIRKMRETANGSNPPRPKPATAAAAPGSRGVQAAEDVLKGMQF